MPLTGDANGDGIVNSQDLATISSQWLNGGHFLAGDLNGDGIVNMQDLAARVVKLARHVTCS